MFEEIQIAEVHVLQEWKFLGGQLGDNDVQAGTQGFKKIMLNSTFPLGQLALKFCLAWASLSCSFNDSTGRGLA